VSGEFDCWALAPADSGAITELPDAAADSRRSASSVFIVVPPVKPRPSPSVGSPAAGYREGCRSSGRPSADGRVALGDQSRHGAGGDREEEDDGGDRPNRSAMAPAAATPRSLPRCLAWPPTAASRLPKPIVIKH
jgi:hypothetical protein